MILESFFGNQKRIMLTPAMKIFNTSGRALLQTIATPISLWLFMHAAWADIPQAAVEPSTPIQHLVILFDENVSFDHYFGTYPHATNPPGAPRFDPLPDTPLVYGLQQTSTSTPHPFRIDRNNALTADQSHSYRAEQKAYHQGRMDRFVEATGNGRPGAQGALATPETVMGYFDGNTVTALWNYAQHFTLSDATFTDVFGPSTPGVLELVSGQTHGAIPVSSTSKASDALLPDGRGGYTLIGDLNPAEDRCSSRTSPTLRMQGKNIGDLLNQQRVSWGNFMGGFDLTRVNDNGSSGCQRDHSTEEGAKIHDYIPHHNGFQYYPATANPSHARPSSLSAIGHSTLDDGVTPDPANHQYDLEDFFSAVRAGHFPAVSILKAPAYQDGHAGYSNPLAEQRFIVRILNFLQQQAEWKSTAVIITYDDSDGWFDHINAPIRHASADPQWDALTGQGHCGTAPLAIGIDGQPVNGRCGPGPRIPLLVVSPWVRANHVDHTELTQTSILRFIEDNWLHGERLGHGSFDADASSLAGLFDFSQTHPNPPLFLDETNGTPVQEAP